MFSTGSAPDFAEGWMDGEDMISSLGISQLTEDVDMKMNPSKKVAKSKNRRKGEGSPKRVNKELICICIAHKHRQ